jgi:hypothetical protein
MYTVVAVFIKKKKKNVDSGGCVPLWTVGIVCHGSVPLQAWEGRAYDYCMENLRNMGFPVDGLAFDPDLVIYSLLHNLKSLWMMTFCCSP